MKATTHRFRAESGLIVGGEGASITRAMRFFERRKLLALRADAIATACDRIADEMPKVVLVLVPPANAAERDALTERTAAVGAVLLHVDPELDDETFEQLLDRGVKASQARAKHRDDPAAHTRATTPPAGMEDEWK